MDDMATAHKRDYAELYRIRDLRLAIESFLISPPSRAHRTTVEVLRSAAADLKADEAQIVRAWD
jgi:hypothetical protein